jgi:hypothetical protein
VVLEASLALEQLLHLVVVRDLAELHRDVLEVGDELARLRDCDLDGLLHGLRVAEVRLLGQVTHGRIGPFPSLAGEVRVYARHDAEQGGLTRAVRADHADLRAWHEGEVEVLDALLVRGVDLGHPLHREDVISHGGSVVPRASALVTELRRTPGLS